MDTQTVCLSSLFPERRAFMYMLLALLLAEPFRSSTVSLKEPPQGEHTLSVRRQRRCCSGQDTVSKFENDGIRFPSGHTEPCKEFDHNAPHPSSLACCMSGMSAIAAAYGRDYLISTKHKPTLNGQLRRSFTRKIQSLTEILLHLTSQRCSGCRLSDAKRHRPSTTATNSRSFNVGKYQKRSHHTRHPWTVRRNG